MSNKEPFPKNLMDKYQINALGDITENDFIRIFDEWAAAGHDRSKDIILKHYKDNITQAAIGKEYGISGARVYQIITRAGYQLKNRCRQMLKERKAVEMHYPAVVLPPSKDDADVTDVLALGLTHAVTMSLHWNGIDTILKLSDQTEKTLLSLPHIGIVAIRKIKDALKKWDLTLKEDD